MEVNYQKTTQLNMDIISFRRSIAFISLLLIPSKKILILLIKISRWFLFRKLDGLTKFFKQNQDIFPNEYFDCIEINDMVKYTLKRDISLFKPEDLTFVDNLYDSFFNLILSKLKLLENNNCVFDEKFYDAFNPQYESFNQDLIKFKEYFYINIYQEPFDEKEIMDYLKVAWE